MSSNETIPKTLRQIQACVISNAILANEITLLWLEAPQIAEIAIPGQFAMLKCGGGAFLRRPLSIHRVSADRTQVAFLFAVLGKGTDWLSRAKPGDKMDVLGPLGNGFKLLPKSREILLLAGGVGLAPMVFMAEKATKNGVRVSLAYGTANNQRYSKELLPSSIKLIEFTDDGSYGRHGLVTESLVDFTDTVDQIFACGPLPMYRALAKQQSLKGKEVQVSLETRMACGMGVCYGCTVKTVLGLKQVCHDGPVFNLKDVVWEEMEGI
jgi:dihydroorotate dehydrogenase electron transfer subunit